MEGGRVQSALAARIFMTIFIQLSWITVNGGWPRISDPKKKTMSELMINVS